MADPRAELADIVVPVAPQVAAAGGMPTWAAAAGLVAAAVLAILIGWGYRRRFARELARIGRSIARREEDVACLAARLDHWARSRLALARLEIAAPPPGIDGVVWADWVSTLAALRFDPARHGDYARLAALCDAARAWRPRA